MTKKINSRWHTHLLPLAVVALFCSGLFTRCAHIGASGPQGGPKDSLPPRVVRMSPQFNATNLWPGQIRIDFDEYIKLKDQQTEFYTSPFLQKKPVLSVKNRSVLIDVDTELDSAQTYVFNLGSSVIDNNEGNPLHNLRYVFSTGGHIDSMYMSGYVSNLLTGDTIKGAGVFFYDAALDTMPEGPDSLLFNLQGASAVVRTLTHGGFVFGNLKPIDYRVYALLDKNGNNMYDPGEDEVAFLDSVVNPATMPPFYMWYDSTRMHVVAEPQTFFNSFVEEPERRQNLSAFTRPTAGRIELKFSAAHPVIDTFTLAGIDPARILVENPKEERDSIVYWLDVPVEELPDTIRGRIAYQRSDSVGQLYLHGQDLRFIWKKPFVAPARVRRPDTLAHDASPKEIKRWERRERKRIAREAKIRAAFVADSLATAAADSIRLAADTTGLALDSLALEPRDTLPVSKMKFAFSGDNPVVPGVAPMLTFELPVRRMDVERIRFFTLGKDSVERDIPFALERDSLRIREYTLRSSEWQEGVGYTLLISDSTVVTLDGEYNSEIRHTLTAAVEKDMGSVDLLISGNTDSTEYIVQIMDQSRTNVLREKAHVTDTDTIRYISPGQIAIRMIQDRNGNGRWDTGKLTARRQPEKVRWYRTAEGDTLELKAPNLEFEVEINLEEVFRDRVFTGSDEMETEESTETDAESAEEDETPRISEKVSSEPRVEGFELTNPRAVRKAEKAARRAARKAKKTKEDEHEHEHDHDHEHEHDEAAPQTNNTSVKP